jgi:hypothetical protein
MRSAVAWRQKSPEPSRTGKIFPRVLKCGGLKVFRKGTRNAHLHGRACAHAEDRERIHWLAAVFRQKAENLGRLRFDSVPIADLAPLMMEPGANGETFWIEPGGSAVGIDRLRKLAQILICGA